MSDSSDDEIFNLSRRKRPYQAVAAKKVAEAKVSVPKFTPTPSKELPNFESDSESENENDNPAAASNNAQPDLARSRIHRTPTPPPMIPAIAPELEALKSQLAEDRPENWRSAYDSPKVTNSKLSQPNGQRKQRGLIQNIKITINLNHPSTKTIQTAFLMSAKDTFDSVIQELSTHCYSCPSNWIILVYRDVEVSPFSTAPSLTTDRDFTIDAYLKTHFEQIRAEKSQEHAKILKELNETEAEVSEPLVSAHATLFSVKLKDKQGEPFKVKVQATTTVDNLLDAFSKSRNVPKKRLRLQFDGDSLDAKTLVKDLDVEDVEMEEEAQLVKHRKLPTKRKKKRAEREATGDAISPPMSPEAEYAAKETTQSPELANMVVATEENDFDVSKLSLGVNTVRPAEAMYSNMELEAMEAELAEAMATPQPLEYPELIPVAGRVDLGWDYHSFMPRTQAGAALVEPTAPPALNWDEDLAEITRQFDKLNADDLEVSPVIIEALPDEILSTVYINPHLASHSKAVEEFRGSATHFPVGDIFFERIKEYEHSLLESGRSKMKLQVLITNASSIASRVWTLRKTSSTQDDRCGDNNRIRHTYTSEDSVLNQEELTALGTVLSSLREETHYKYKTSLFKAKLVKLWIQNHLDEFLTNFNPDLAVRGQPDASDKDTLKHFLDILFFFERKSFVRQSLDDPAISTQVDWTVSPFSKDIRGWITHLMSALLPAATFDDQRYILLHYLRTEGISRWGASFIQWPIPKPWSEAFLSHYLTVIHAILSPIEEVEEAMKHKEFELSQIRDSLKQLETLDWIVVDEKDLDQELHSAKTTIIDEDDYLALMDQLNSMPIFISYLQEALAGQIHGYSPNEVDNLFLHIFAVTSHLHSSLSQGLNLFSFRQYPFMIKRIAQLITDISRSLCDFLLANLNLWGASKTNSDLNLEVKIGESEVRKTSIQAELDACFIRTVKILMSSPRKGVWPFLASTRLDFVSRAAKWRLLSQVILAKDENRANPTKMSLEELTSRFDDDWSSEKGFFSLIESNTPEIVHMLTFLANLVVDDNLIVPLTVATSSGPKSEPVRQEPFADLAAIVSRVIFKVSFLSTYHRDTLSKVARDLLCMICESQRAVISHLLSWTRDSFQAMESLPLYLFAELPLNSWSPTHSDFLIIQSMLRDPIGTQKFRLAKFIINKLHWGFSNSNADLFIPRTYHRMIALAITNIYLDRQSLKESRSMIGATTAYASSAISSVGNIARSGTLQGPVDKDAEFNEWCWNIVVNLSLFQKPKSVDIYALETFHDGIKPYESLESTTLATLRGAMKTNPLAAYCVLMISEVGYIHYLFEREGWTLLQLLAEGNFHSAIIKAIVEVLFNFAKTLGIEVLGSPGFTQFFSQFYRNKLRLPSLQVKYATDTVEEKLSPADSEIWRLFVTDICSPDVPQPDKELLLAVFLKTLFADADWVTCRNSIRLVDSVAEIAVLNGHLPLLLQELKQEYRRLLSLHESSQSSASRFSLLNPLESAKSLVATIGELYNGYPTLLVGSERFGKDTLWNRVGTERECFWFAFASLLVEMEEESADRNRIGDALVRDPLATLSSLGKECAKPFSHFTIFRVAYQIAETPEQHPTLPLLFQVFFSLYFERSKQVLKSTFSCFGYRFVYERKDVIERIDRKLDACLKKMGEANDTLLVSELKGAYNSMSLWLKEKRLTSNDVYIDHLSPSFNPKRLKEVLQGSVFRNPLSWNDLLPVEMIQAHVTSLMDHNRVLRHSRRGSVSLPKSMSFDRHLKTVSPALPPPLFSPRPPAVLGLSDYTQAAAGDILKTSSPLLLSKAARFLEIVDEHQKCDQNYADLMKNLYVNENKRGRVEKKCSASCSGPAIISYKFCEVKVIPEVKNGLKENRLASEGFSTWDNMDPQVCISTLRLLRIVDWIFSDHKPDDSHDFILKFFYDILREYSSEYKAYPPIDAVLKDVVIRIGGSFVSISDEENVKIFKLWNVHNGSILAKIFEPAVSLNDFTKMYSLIQDNLSEKGTLQCLLFWRRFDVQKWLDSIDHISSIEFLKILLKCIEATSSLTLDDSAHQIFDLHRENLKHYLAAIKSSPRAFLAATKIILDGFVSTPMPVVVLRDYIDTLGGSASALDSGDLNNLKLEKKLCEDLIELLSSILDRERKSLYTDPKNIFREKHQEILNLLSILFTSQSLYSLQTELQSGEIAEMARSAWLPLFGFTRSSLFGPIDFYPWPQETVGAAKEALAAFTKVLLKVTRHSSSSSRVGQCVWATYAMFVSAQCPGYALELVQDIFSSSVDWGGFSVTIGTVQDILQWISMEHDYSLSLSVFRFVCDVVQRSSWNFDSTGPSAYELDSFTMKSLSAMFSLMARSHYIYTSVEDRATFLNSFRATIIQMGDWTQLTPDAFVHIVHVLPLKWKTNCSWVGLNDKVKGNPLSYILDMLLLLTAVGNAKDAILSDSGAGIVGHITSSKLSCFFDYVCDLLSLQASSAPVISKTVEESQPHAFAVDSLGSIVCQISELSADLPDGIPGKTTILSTVIGRLLSLLNSCSKSSKSFPFIWSGIRDSISKSSNPIVWLSQACTSIASAEYMALTAELCIECEILHTRDSAKWNEIKVVLALPELEAEAFVSHCLNHALILTLYAHALQKLQECRGQLDLRTLIGEQLGLWIAGMKMESVEEGKEGKIILLMMKFSELLREELVSLPLPEHHSRLRAHLPTIADALLRWGQDRANQGLWATLGFGPKSRFSSEFRLLSRAAGAFLAIRLLGNGSSRKDDEQKVRLVDSIISIGQTRDFENCWGMVEGITQWLRDEHDRRLPSFYEFLQYVGAFSPYVSLGIEN
ncbi:Ectopic P granules protein 5 [Phlyctochytrium planicorne]|nr:Ectopic P granules protein 5 [Phlyctochytrium planicorne]